MIKEDYVSFETAKLLKEKGFWENCPFSLSILDEKTGEVENVRCPTLQMAMKWLRVEKGFYIYASLGIDYDEDVNGVKYYHDPLYYGNIVRTNDGKQMYDGGGMYDQPEYAVEAMVRYCLENLI